MSTVSPAQPPADQTLPPPQVGRLEQARREVARLDQQMADLLDVATGDAEPDGRTVEDLLEVAQRTVKRIDGVLVRQLRRTRKG